MKIMVVLPLYYVHTRGQGLTASLQTCDAFRWVRHKSYVVSTLNKILVVFLQLLLTYHTLYLRYLSEDRQEEVFGLQYIGNMWFIRVATSRMLKKISNVGMKGGTSIIIQCTSREQRHANISPIPISFSITRSIHITHHCIYC